MKKAILFTLVAGISMFYLSACGGDEKKEGDSGNENQEQSSTPANNNEGNAAPEITTDVVQNNNTAAEPPVPAGPLSAIEFENSVYDFGEVEAGEMVKHVFTFTNTGDEDLIISQAKPSCGCTVPDFSKEPIPPGGTGEINVEFNSAGKNGPQNKTVTVTANTEPATTVLTIKGAVSGEAPAQPAS